MTADWDDIDAAIKVALARCRVAPMSRSDEIDEKLFDPLAPVSEGVPIKAIDLHLLAMSGQEGSLRVERLRDGTQADPVEIRITCEMDPLGGPATESCVVDSICDRLTQLRGKDFVPLRWSN